MVVGGLKIKGSGQVDGPALRFTPKIGHAKITLQNRATGQKCGGNSTVIAKKSGNQRRGGMNLRRAAVIVLLGACSQASSHMVLWGPEWRLRAANSVSTGLPRPLFSSVSSVARCAVVLNG